MSKMKQPLLELVSKPGNNETKDWLAVANHVYVRR